MDLNISIKQLNDEIIKCDISVKSLIKNIWECETTDDLNHLNMEIAKQIHRHKTSIEELAKHLNSVTKGSKRQSLESEIDGHRHQLEINSMSLRKANAASQKLIATKDRELLFNSGSASDARARRRVSSKMDKETLANETKGLTDNLSAVSRMLAEEVSKSEHTLHSLINSSATATETQEEFKTMGNVIVYSRTILTKYGRREITDKVLILLALAFFFACVIYVVIKRLF